MPTRLLVLACVVALIAVSRSTAADGFQAGLASSVEGYAESDHNSYAAARSVVVGWRNRRADAPGRLGKTDARLRLMYSVEEDAEKTDSERFRDATQWSADVVHPFATLSSARHPWLLSVWAWLEGAENHQQLEEREYMVALGSGLDRRFGTRVRWDLRAGLALACNEEEKDDDWPRENFDIGRDQLNRRGCGFFGRWNNRLLMPNGNRLGVKLDYYEGRFGYGAQDYSRSRVELYLEVPLVSPRHQLRVSGRTIRRYAELDLTGFEDRLNQVGLAYFYHF